MIVKIYFITLPISSHSTQTGNVHKKKMNKKPKKYARNIKSGYYSIYFSEINGCGGFTDNKIYIKLNESICDYKYEHVNV